MHVVIAMIEWRWLHLNLTPVVSPTPVEPRSEPSGLINYRIAII